MKTLALTTLAGTFLAGTMLANTVTNLQATYRSGQVFLTWQERDLPADALFTVHSHHEPITADNLSAAQTLASGIHRKAIVRWARGNRGGLWLTQPLDRADLESIRRFQN